MLQYIQARTRSSLWIERYSTANQVLDTSEKTKYTREEGVALLQDVPDLGPPYGLYTILLQSFTTSPVVQ